MTKQYDIVNLIGNDSFTYQLYADMSVPVEGTSTVTSQLIMEAPDLFVMSVSLIVGTLLPGHAYTYIRNSVVSSSTPYSIYLFCGDTYTITFEDDSPQIVGVPGQYKTILFVGYNLEAFFFRCPSPANCSIITLDEMTGLTYKVVQNGTIYSCLKEDAEITNIPYIALDYGSNTSSLSSGPGGLLFKTATFGTFP